MTSRRSSDAPAPFLQRCSEQRLRADWVSAAQTDPGTRYLISRGTTQLVRREPRTEIAFVRFEQLAALSLQEAQLLLLGWFQGERCVLVELAPDSPFSLPGAVFEELRALLPLLPADQAELLTYARALLVWRSRHRHCGVCGAPTKPRAAGHVLACSSCGADFFPRIDPAIIVLVSAGSRVLLGRQKVWPPGRYSALAGFVEAGESLEQAVVREVEEETGARVTSVRYFGSQPWPFPASLMLGFHADAPQGPVRLDGELEDARWFELEELRAGSTLLLPPAHTIARRLMEAWIETQTLPAP
jgi:NAD+ diphosphatase